MELVITIVVLIFLVWYFVFRNKDDVHSAIAYSEPVAPYKVEPPTQNINEVRASIPETTTKPEVELKVVAKSNTIKTKPKIQKNKQIVANKKQKPQKDKATTNVTISKPVKTSKTKKPKMSIAK